MIRGGLIAMLYHDVLNMDTIKSPKSSPVALISMDMEKIVFGLQTIHQTWAGLLEFSVAVWLLQRQLGLAVVGSVLTTLGEFLDSHLCWSIFHWAHLSRSLSVETVLTGLQLAYLLVSSWQGLVADAKCGG